MPPVTRTAPAAPPQSNSLIATTVVGMLVPIGFSRLPLAIAGLIGGEPRSWRDVSALVMFVLFVAVGWRTAPSSD